MTRKASDLSRQDKDILARLLNLYILVMGSHKLMLRAIRSSRAVPLRDRVKGRAAVVALLLTHCLFVTTFPMFLLGRAALATWRTQPRYLKELVLLRGTEVNLVIGKEVYAGNGRWYPNRP